MQKLVATYSAILLAAIMLMGCSTTAKQVSAKDIGPYSGCNVAPDMWRQIAVPSNREALLDLPEEISKNPVRNFFRSIDDLHEVWFESSSGDGTSALCLSPTKWVLFRR